MDAATQPNYAGFWIRSAAATIDSLFYTLVPLAVSVAFGEGSHTSFFLGNGLVVVYYVACLSSPWQGTFGKYILKLHVQTRDGGKITPLKALFRLIACAFPVIPFTLVPIIFPSMELLVQAFLTKDFFLIQRAMQSNKDLIYALLGTSWFALITMFIWFLPIVFSKQKTGIHDLICKTRVVHGRSIAS